MTGQSLQMSCAMCDDVRALLAGEIVCWRNAKRHGGIRQCAAAVCLMPLVVLLIVMEVLLACVWSFLGMVAYGWVDFFAWMVWFGTCCFCGDPKYPLSPCEYRSMEVKKWRVAHVESESSGEYIAREAGPWEVIPGCGCSTLCCEHVVVVVVQQQHPPPQALQMAEGHATTGATTGTIASLSPPPAPPPQSPPPSSAPLVVGHSLTVSGSVVSLREVVVHPVADPLPMPSAPPHERMEGQTGTYR
jgi:hypothetical protein